MTYLRGTPTAVLAAVALALAPTTGAAAGSGAVASSSVCPGQSDGRAPAAAQERTMLCLVESARRHSSLPPLAADPALGRAATHKSGDILRCGAFSHEACGREFTYWMQRVGYLRGGCWRAAENIAWGTGTLRGPGAIFRAWMRSSGHRENILGDYADTGIGLEGGSLEGHAGARVWTEEFGSTGC